MRKNLILIFVMILLVSIMAVSGAALGAVSSSGAGGGLMGVGVNSKTNMIYVADSSNNTVLVVDGSSNSITAVVPVGEGPVGIGVNPVTNMIYVANMDDCNISVINGADNSVVGQPIAVEGMPSSLYVNASANKIYVSCINSSNPANGAVSVINGASNQVEKTITGLARPMGICCNSAKNTGYVACSNDAKVLAFNGTTGTATGWIAVGNKPSGVCLDVSANRIYVANEDDDTVSVINGDDNSIIKTVQVGDKPLDICFNPNTNQVYVANGGCTVSVIDAADNEVINTITMDTNPMGIGVNPATGNVYVSNSSDVPVAIINGFTSSARSLTAGETELPSITAITPTSGVIGTEVTIDGANFGDVQGTSYVCFNQMGVSECISWSDTQIKCKVPNINGTLTVKVKVSDNYSNEVTFTSRRPEASGWAMSLNGGLNYLIFASDENAGKPGLLFMIDYSNIFFPRIISSYIFGIGIDPNSLGWTVDAPPGQNTAAITGKCTCSGAAMMANNFSLVIEDRGTSWFMINNQDTVHLTIYNGDSSTAIYDIHAVVGIGEMMIDN